MTQNKFQSVWLCGRKKKRKHLSSHWCTSRGAGSLTTRKKNDQSVPVPVPWPLVFSSAAEFLHWGAKWVLQCGQGSQQPGLKETLSYPFGAGADVNLGEFTGKRMLQKSLGLVDISWDRPVHPPMHCNSWVGSASPLADDGSQCELLWGFRQQDLKETLARVLKTISRKPSAHIMKMLPKILHHNWHFILF